MVLKIIVLIVLLGALWRDWDIKNEEAWNDIDYLEDAFFRDNINPRNRDSLYER